ncbi:LLM class flavin-dependent oxidoreductase [Fodinicola acaciae]|uniref:LLM class flavin-dependent oxidoreductase n=1 Tax=Fodinicola acaciae TaxID=2681555 RepID=UPI0013D58CDB|nr:LLM class flavin-dependent oxidoreductase [Fodinicola acaciae]
MPALSRPILGIAADAAGHHPAGWTQSSADPRTLLTAGYHVGLAQLAERGRFDFLTIADSFAPGPETDATASGRLDALLTAARVGPVTRHIGLLPTVTTTHTEPFHVSKSLATLDFVSLGRAGWQVEVSRTAAEAAHFGRKTVAPSDKLWSEASDAIDVVRRLWDSWEDDAEIRDAATGRFIDRDKLHYVDFSGEFFSVRGPSITPRPPQGHPLIAVRVDDPEAVAVAARWADIVRTAAKDITEAAAIRERVRAEIAANGRDPDEVAFLVDVATTVAETAAEATALDERLNARKHFTPPGLTFVGGGAELAERIEEWRAYVDGFTLSAAVLPQGLEAIVDHTIPVLTDRGIHPRAYPPGSFRERFGLRRPENQYAEAT